MISVTEIPAVIYAVVFQFYGRIEGYYAVGIGKNECGELGVEEKELETATALPVLSALIYDANEIYKGFGRLLVKDESEMCVFNNHAKDVYYQSYARER